jgi:hypothetical protein
MAKAIVQISVDPNTKDVIFNLVRGSNTLSNGDTLIIRAPKDTSITVMFPPTRDPFGIGTTTLKAGETLEIVVYAVAGRYPFTIYSHATNTMICSKDASGPEVIIH